jgi:hypothetical protein
MTLEIGFTNELTNTQFAPLAIMLLVYQQQEVFAPLSEVVMGMREREFNPQDKLLQVLVSILSGCETLSEVNTRLKAEDGLAQVLGWKRFADQSNLSRTLDGLNQQSVAQLRQAVTTIWHRFSRVAGHNYHGKLWLDYDLSGLPCGPQAQASQKGYFSGKKTAPDGSWLASA